MMADPSCATDANTPSTPSDIPIYLLSPHRTIGTPDLWSESYVASATSSDNIILDHFDFYDNHASLLDPVHYLATDVFGDYYQFGYPFLDRSDDPASMIGYEAVGGDATATYPPYFALEEEVSPSLLPTEDIQPARQQESEDAPVISSIPPNDESIPPPPQPESYDRPDQKDASQVPHAGRTRKKGRQQRSERRLSPSTRLANEESQPPMSAPSRSAGPLESSPSTQKTDPRNLRASLKRKSNSKPNAELDRAGKRRRVNSTQDAGHESREDRRGRIASCGILRHELPCEEEIVVKPRVRLSKKQQWDEASYHEDDDSNVQSPGLGEPGPPTWARNSERRRVPSSGNIDSDPGQANMPARTSHRASLKKSKDSSRFRCPFGCVLPRSGKAMTFSRRLDLDRHLTYGKAHIVGQRKSSLECFECHKIFSRPDSLTRHRGNPSACAKNIAQKLKGEERFEEDSDCDEEDDSASDHGE